ncbi:hypothetical protein HPB47_001577 [Ixodes persulcatus]|uniref:Uncharacterized protein n=1 Tax=Ixodes persulcatus TaxID=34615 RepID=A0AC60PNN0_IXOPE|nr:hypothetical protein HPB47_001577 [Ixodes persulcatus]
MTKSFGPIPNRITAPSPSGFVGVERRSENRWSRRLKQDIGDKKDPGAEVNPSGVQTRDSPQSSTKSSCRCPTAISDRGGGHNLSTVTTSALQEDSGPGTLKPKHLSRGYYAHDTLLTQDSHAAGRVTTSR